jgi:hypothetical protein
MAGGTGRNLTINALAQANKLTGAKPFMVLRIFPAGGGFGTLYFSDAAHVLTEAITTTPCVLSWGTIDQPGMRIGSQASAAIYPLANLAVKISLADATLRSTFLGLNPPVGWWAQVYQMWDGLSWADDKVLLYFGVLGAIGGGTPQTFADKDVAITLNIIDRFKSLLDRDVGNRADIETFPNVFKEHEGRVIPIVYGRAQKVKAVMIDGPKIGRLMADITDDDGTFYVEGGKEFPATAGRIRIGEEIIRGSFNGNVFTALNRGVVYATTSSAGHYDGDPLQIYLPGLTGYEDEYVGMYAGIAVGDHWEADDILVYGEGSPSYFPKGSAKPASNGYNGLQWRRISGWDATNKVLNIEHAFIKEGLKTTSPYGNAMTAGTQTWAFAGMTVTIGTIAQKHAAGEEVVELKTPIYALNNAPSKRIRAVYFRGAKGQTMSVEDFVNGGAPNGTYIQPFPADMTFYGNININPSSVTDYQAIPTSFYHGNLDNNSFASALGHNITTVQLHALPMYVPLWRVEGFDLWADVDGITSDNTPSGTVITNPSEIIQDALVNRIGCSVGDIDPDSFWAAHLALLWCEFRGCVDRIMRGQELIAWLAMQARSRVRFEAGLIYMDYLSNARAETPLVPTVSRDNAEMEKLELSWEDPGQCVNEIEYKYKGFDGEFKTGIVKDTTSIAAYERRTTTIDCTLCASQVHAKEAALFWLYQWSRPFSGGKITGFTPFLPFLRGENIIVHEPNWSLESVPAEITGIRQTQERIDVSFRSFTYPGCSGSCEAFCEVNEESISAEACSGVCEAACQSLSQLACEDRAENMQGCGGNICQVANQVVDWDPPPDWSGGVAEGCCQLTCQDGCVSDCQSGCELACEPGEVVNECATSCIDGCETGCEPGTCQTVCQDAYCMTGCVSTCENEMGCQVSCQSPNCQNNCQYDQTCSSCQASCVDNCQSACEASCEPVHVVNTCDAGCIVTACVSQCTVGGCETSCEMGETVSYSCSLSCEVSCQGACELSDRDWTGV